MNYTFDPKKQAANVAKHGVWFSAADEFDWEQAIVIIDSRREYAESRFIATAPVESRLYVMIFCLRDTEVRIISLRKANRREVSQYEDQI